MSTIKLGVKAKDKVTGFEGIITSRIEYLTGCAQFGLTPKAVDGKTLSTEYFDGERLEYVDEGIAPQSVTDSNNPGGPNRDAPR